MGTFVQDIRYGLRMLAKNPGFPAVAVMKTAHEAALQSAKVEPRFRCDLRHTFGSTTRVGQSDPWLHKGIDIDETSGTSLPNDIRSIVVKWGWGECKSDSTKVVGSGPKLTQSGIALGDMQVVILSNPQLF
jgi:hypothetical protein